MKNKVKTHWDLQIYRKALELRYVSRDDGRQLYITYDGIIATIFRMIHHPKTWVLPQ